jgi:hypothetical protein
MSSHNNVQAGMPVLRLLSGQHGLVRQKLLDTARGLAGAVIVLDQRGGGCLWKSLKKSSFPVFVFPAGGNWRLAEAKEGSKRKKLHFGVSECRTKASASGVGPD